MSLVGYAYSDDDDNDDNDSIGAQSSTEVVELKSRNEIQENSNKILERSQISLASDVESTDEDAKAMQSGQCSSSSSSSKLLPNLPLTQGSVSYLSKNAVKRTATGRIQIAAPSFPLLNGADSDDDLEDEEERQRKRLKKSDQGSHLISILPKPKNAFAIPKANLDNITSSAPSTSSLTALIPNSVANRNKSKPAISDNNSKPEIKASPVSNAKSDSSAEPTAGLSSFFFTNNYDDDDEDDIRIPFEKQLEEEKINFASFAPSTSSTLPFVIPSDDAPVYGPSKPDISDSGELTDQPTTILNPNDDVTYKKFIASKFGNESASEIKIVDFDMSKHLSQNTDWIKNITLEKEDDAKLEGKGPNATARRKNQITYLAYQAQKREIDLKNQWAQNRVAKNQTRAKYGF